MSPDFENDPSITVTGTTHMEGEVITQVCTSGGENLGHCLRTLPATLSSFESLLGGPHMFQVLARALKTEKRTG